MTLVQASPSDQLAEVAFTLAQVGLQCDPHGARSTRSWRFAEFGFFENGFEEREREVLQLVALHIKIHEGASGARATQNGAQTLFEGCDRTLWVGGVNVGRKRGHFDREIESREGSLRAEVAESGLPMTG